MATVTTRGGDLLDCGADMIVQQCNCLTVRAHGLSADIVARFGPAADPYAQRQALPNRPNLARPEDRPAPGSLLMLRPPGDAPVVACLFAQWAPGKVKGKWSAIYPSPPSPFRETPNQRERWFAEALAVLASKLGDADRPLTVAFPDRIGCGLAGGDWAQYEGMIRDFARAVAAHQHAVVIIKQQE